MAPSFWLPCQNSFNQTIFLALQDQLHAVGHPAACTTLNKNGELIDFGVTLDASGPFSKNCPVVADCFRIMNARRNRLPVSHPYEKKTVQQTQYFTAKERREFLVELRKAYSAFVALMP
jgi:adenine-specific DNA glycosylase